MSSIAENERIDVLSMTNKDGTPYENKDNIEVYYRDGKYVVVDNNKYLDKDNIIIQVPKEDLGEVTVMNSSMYQGIIENYLVLDTQANKLKRGEEEGSIGDYIDLKIELTNTYEAYKTDQYIGEKVTELYESHMSPINNMIYGYYIPLICFLVSVILITNIKIKLPFKRKRPNRG